MNTRNDDYRRPQATNGTRVGARNRRRWSDRLGRKLSEIVPSFDRMQADKDACDDPQRASRDSGANWVSVRIRVSQMAVIQLLQGRHLSATGKEISRAEVLAALMAVSLASIIENEDFGGDSN
ncbi:hypothetical protein [Jannaschia sp. 2305UL9-9]|uniref:hypothetical protein n=1 Tax=Jannaschia sp. 2305UL9-9 TaxID=3121638 RepID=UPI0035277067